MSEREMHGVLHMFDNKAYTNCSAISGYFLGVEKCRPFCNVLIDRGLKNGVQFTGFQDRLHFSLRYVRNLPASTAQVFFIFQDYSALGLISLMNRAGLPPTTVMGGTSCVTTLLAPTIAP